MTTDRWKLVSRLYHQARERTDIEQRTLLDLECGEDLELRREVESLLEQDVAARSFLERPAIDIAESIMNADEHGTLVGRRLGSYQISAFLGAGGMGDVYRARDEKLGRDVAIKVLPSAFTTDVQHMTRLEREARILASLNHPHIGAIYGLEESGNSVALVLELVDGPTLAGGIRTGLPLREALGIARQIADALDAAHTKGIIHRDLKPANIAIASDGTVKVLDFGLAMSPPREDKPSSLPLSTIAGDGLIVGTETYMSPEQARGLRLDKRTDIWSFGCVLYEMLVSTPPFRGETVTDTLAAIIEREPDWNALPPATPASIRRLLRRCLQKDLSHRLHDIADARIEIEDALAATDDHRQPETPVGRRALLTGMTGLAIGAVGGGLLTRSFWATPPVQSDINRVLVGVGPADSLISQPTRTAVALSPDGRRIVYSALRGGRQSLFLRAMDQLEATPIAGSEDGSSPFFSPDGKWIGFWSGKVTAGAIGELKKVPVGGGPAATICRTGPLFGVSWGKDDSIVFGTQGSGLLRVTASGGTPEPLTALNTAANERGHRLPFLLPNGQGVLFSIHVGGRPDEGPIAVYSFTTRTYRIVIDKGADPRYVRSGHLVYAHNGVLMAARFDADRQVVTGPTVPLVEGVMQAVNVGSVVLDNTGAAQFSVSDSDALVYVPGGIGSDEGLGAGVMWVDRSGHAEQVPVPPRRYGGLRLSSDGARFVTFTGRLPTSTIWLYDFSRGTMSRLTTEGEAVWPIWSPGETRVTFLCVVIPNTKPGIASLSLESGSIELVTGPRKEPTFGLPASWSPDGQSLAYVRNTADVNWEIRVLSVSDGNDQRLLPLRRTPCLERYPVFAPDGRWIAYATDESGRDEVYIQRYPSGERQLVSSAGGVSPVWSRNGRELFYSVVRPGGLEMMVVDVTMGSTFMAGRPRRLFEGPFANRFPLRPYDVAPDGKRFLMLGLTPAPSQPPITQLVVVFNWLDELKRRVPN